MSASLDRLEPERIERPCLLIGEGRDELAFFTAFLRHHGLADQIQAMEYGGKQKLGAWLRTLSMRPGFAIVRALGVTRDADASPEDAARSVNSALLSARFDVPSGSGQFATRGGFRIGTLILPTGLRPGDLETLALESLGSDPAVPCAERFLECAQLAPGDDAAESWSKRLIHCWLATRPTLKPRLGHAAEAGWLPLEAPAFAELRAFAFALAAP